MLGAIRRLLHRLTDKFHKLIPYKISLEEPDEAIYSASYSGESLTDSIRLMRRHLKRLDPRSLRRLKPLLELLSPLAEASSLLALFGGIGIVLMIAHKYLSSKADNTDNAEEADLEDKLEDTWVTADGVYFASFGASSSQAVGALAEKLGAPAEAVQEMGDAIGGLTGLVSGPAELALASMELRDALKGKADDRAETLADALSYGGWGLGDLADGTSTALDLVKGASLASLEVIGNLAYGLAGLMDAILGAFDLRRGIKAKKRRQVIRGLAEIVSGLGFTLSAFLPAPFNVVALIAVGVAEAVNLLSRVKVEKVSPSSDEEGRAVEPASPQSS